MSLVTTCLTIDLRGFGSEERGRPSFPNYIRANPSCRKQTTLFRSSVVHGASFKDVPRSKKNTGLALFDAKRIFVFQVKGADFTISNPKKTCKAVNVGRSNEENGIFRFVTTVPRAIITFIHFQSILTSSGETIPYCLS